MTDVQTTHAPRQAPVSKPGRHLRRKVPKGVPHEASAKVLAAIRYMIHGPEGGSPVARPEAARLAGLADETLRKAFRSPAVVKAYNDELDVLRTSERARNLHTAIGVRDDKKMAKTASGNRVRIEAARFIEGRDGPASINVNVGVQNVQPGYQIAIPGEYATSGRQMLKLAGSTRNVADMQADVPTDGQGTPE